MEKSYIPVMQANFLLYTAADGKVKVEVFVKDETVWLTQKAMAELFQVKRPAITKHLKNIFESRELQENSVSSILEHTAPDGKTYSTKFYNLDAIIAIGYRVNSYQATQFRIWATKTLKEFIIIVQNKLHWAITGKTAAEIVYDSADASKIYMGLTSWKHAPEGKILKSDVSIAKNYLNKAHIDELNRIVSAYLDLAENRAKRQIVTKMEDWVQFLHSFLELSKYPILKDKGRVSTLEAKLKAEQEYEEYRIKQDENYLSDFDKEIKRIMGKKDNDT